MSTTNPTRSVPTPVLPAGEDAQGLRGAGHRPEDPRAQRCGAIVARAFLGPRAAFPAPGAMVEVGQVLEAAGIPVRRYAQACLHDLAAELALGHQVVLRISSVELGYAAGPIGTFPEGLVPAGAADALLVVHLDTTDAAGPRVVVQEPWEGERVADFPLEWFLGALSDARFGLVATAQPAPRHLPEMARFPYETGRLGEICGLPWADFEALAGRPQAWLDHLAAHVDEAVPPSDDAEPTGADLDPEPFDDETAYGAET